MQKKGKFALNYIDLMQNGPIDTQAYQKWNQKQIQKSKGRLYVSWRNSKGVDCKMIGPQTKCFCDHRYKQHDCMQNTNKKIHCKAKKCSCLQYFYIPTYGAYDFKCLCKHSYKQHDPITKKCRRSTCGGCSNKFNSTWTCSCGLKFFEHTTVVQTFEQRKNNGKSFGDMQRLGNELDQINKKGSLLNPNLHQIISIQNNEKAKKQDTKQVVRQTRKKDQLQKLNKKLNKNVQQYQELKIVQEIVQGQFQGQTPIYDLFIKPHNHKKVILDIKKLRL